MWGLNLVSAHAALGVCKFQGIFTTTPRPQRKSLRFEEVGGNGTGDRQQIDLHIGAIYEGKVDRRLETLAPYNPLVVLSGLKRSMFAFKCPVS